MNRTQLKQQLEKENVRPEAYSLSGEALTYEGLVLRQDQGRWRIDHYERGTWSSVAVFGSEQEACEHLYVLLLRDPTSKYV